MRETRRQVLECSVEMRLEVSHHFLVSVLLRRGQRLSQQQELQPESDLKEPLVEHLGTVSFHQSKTLQPLDLSLQLDLDQVTCLVDLVEEVVLVYCQIKP